MVSVTSVAGAPAPRLEAELEHEPLYGLARQLAGIPPVRALRIHNRGAGAAESLDVRLEAESLPLESFETRIEGIPAGGTYNLNEIPLAFPDGYLEALQVRAAGSLRLRIRAGGADVLETVWPIEALPPNEWSGAGPFPELLAAFVIPGARSIAELAREAGREWRTRVADGNPPNGTGRARSIVQAVFGALVKRQFAHDQPPAGFPIAPARLRFPDEALELGEANAPELALTAAAVLERCGLHPLAAFSGERAMAGAWLVDEWFGGPSVDDPVLLRKHMDAGQIVLFNAAEAARGGGADFESAAAAARALLDDEEAFRFAVDIRAARREAIVPMAIRFDPTGPAEPGGAAGEAADDGEPGEPAEAPGSETMPAVEAPEDDNPFPWGNPYASGTAECIDEGAERAETAETAPARVRRWKHKLLDLSLRNRLLNFRETRKTCPLDCAGLDRLEDALAAGEAFRVLPDSKIPKSATAGGAEAAGAFLLDEMKKGRLYAPLDEAELDKRLLDIFREYRSGMEEGGANTLYLALGFLRWSESGPDGNFREAPLVLVPLEARRPSVREGFLFAMSEDEARVNVTLLQKLETDFKIKIGGLDPLPSDDSGIDLREAFGRFRRAVLPMAKWEVVEKARIGHFSFSKFLMWHDLEHRFEEFCENPLTRHLAERQAGGFGGAAFPDEAALDEAYPPESVFCPAGADASQLRAVMAAAEGKTFVLQGPPGTGKSQTIVNAIAQCLAGGETVLFVSAKMAALNVVHDRLAKLGLGPFCLELHSNKTGKRRVLDQLEEALAASAGGAAERWPRETRKLKSLRDELNQHAAFLRTPRSHGATPFEALANLAGLRGAPWAELEWPDPQAVTPAFRREAADALDGWIAAANAVGKPSAHPWRAAGLEAWNPQAERNALALADETRSLLAAHTECLARLATTLGVDASGWPRSGLDTLAELMGLLKMETRPTRALLEADPWGEAKTRAGGWIAAGRRRDENRARVLQTFREDVLRIPFGEIKTLLEKARNAYPPVSWIYGWKARRALRPYSPGGSLPKVDELIRLLECAEAWLRGEAELDAAGDGARILFGDAWNGGEADWDALDAVLEWADAFRALWPRVPADGPDERRAIRNRWIELAAECRDETAPDAAAGKEFSGYLEREQAIGERQRALGETLNLDVDAAWGGNEAPDWPGTCMATLEGWLNHPRGLHPWCGYVRAARRCAGLGLAPLEPLLEREGFEPDGLREAFRHSFYRWCVDRLLEEEPALARFQSYEHERKIARFAEKDEKILALARDVLAARLCENLPNPDFAHESSEVGIAKREIRKRSRHMPVRKLIGRLSALLPRLKPCFLMSPLSVAQYLPREYPRFDVVIFDEASQIPVWDAIGPLGRGRRAVVVGDSRQLPPTSFFEKTDEGDEPLEEGAVEDLQSILEECEAAAAPALDLKWHYRSRHEHLIAFSNYHYYGNRLITFPPVSESGGDLGIEFRYMENGVYGKGGSRDNPAEARAVADAVARRLTDPETRGQSIGVVTLNMQQQGLIEDLLEKARRELPAIEPYFSSEHPEPVIVKNLENVQGDERAVIMLSIGYGPDSRGRVSMNFGPLNKEGGERRLNVAVTRARRKVIVFSSLRADDLDLSRTRAVGVAHLKAYLDYAERGPKAIAEAFQSGGAEAAAAPLGSTIAKALRARGWTVDERVGCSGFRIDLAVADPGQPDRFALGIECDGPSYHAIASARDRDRLRAEVLRGLGWNLHRVWSIDWWRDPEGEIEKIEKAIRRASANRPKPEPEPEPIPELAESEVVFQPAAPPEKSAPGWDDDKPAAPSEDGDEAGAVSDELPALPGAEWFEPAEEGTPAGTPESFYDPDSGAEIQAAIREIAAREAPMAFTRLARLAAARWNLSRAGSRIRERIAGLIPAGEYVLIEDRDDTFVWPSGMREEEYTAFRLPAPGGVRAINEIPTAEIANAAHALLGQQAGLPLDALAAETARLFGYRRAAGKTRAAILPAIERLEREGKCVIEDGFAKWTGGPRS